jgi:Holliday junction resolvasome RuvABC DNA-binding subunit
LRVRCRDHNRLHAERVFGKEHVAQAIHFPRKRYSADDALRAAQRGLTNMGFRSAEAERALAAVVARRPDGAGLPVAEVLREALALLG